MRCRCDHSCWENPVLVGSRVQDRGRTAAVELRSGLDVTPGILGMELLRLGLERGRTAAEAVTVMTDLLETYGQYGAGTVSTDRAAAAYDNSFLVADPTEMWVLETTGRRWVTKRVRNPFWALSNEPTLRDDWEFCTPDLESHATEQGWKRTRERLDFAAAVADPGVPLQVSHIRLQRSREPGPTPSGWLRTTALPAPTGGPSRTSSRQSPVTPTAAATTNGNARSGPSSTSSSGNGSSRPMTSPTTAPTSSGKP